MVKKKIRVGIVGYGNLGRGVELAVQQNDDMELVGIFSRRDPKSVKTATNSAPVYSTNKLDTMTDDIDVLALCGGSATDLPVTTPKYAQLFHVVDSFDTHARIPQHYKEVDSAARAGGKIAIISAGWDPGLFSLNRVLSEAVLPNGSTYTFWGKGVSQGHSDAVRRIDGVVDARQYTIPIEAALDRVRSGESPNLSTGEKHIRVCYVVAKEDADTAKIQEEILTMPNYFADYNTTVHFVSAEELKGNHSGMPHGGVVIRSGTTGINGENKEIFEFHLKLDSNPEFTASVLTAYLRAAVKMAHEGQSGCKTVLDVAPAYLINMSQDDMLKNMV